VSAFRPGSRCVGAPIVVLCAMFASEVLGDSRETDKPDLSLSAANADDLFRVGKERMAQQDYAQACSMFDRSFQLDPATGTLLALAICHEREGKLAAAFREYSEVVVRSKHEARPDREKAARDKASALEARLSTLTIKTLDAGEVEGLEVRINGALIDSARLGQAIPVYGGTQRVEASAHGKRTWHTQVTVAESTDAKTVIIPLLEALAAPAAPLALPRASARPPQQTRPATESSGLSTAQWVGIGTMGAGVVGLGLGTFFAMRAVSKNEDSGTGCNGDLCTPIARQERLDARAFGNAASVAFIAGGALASVGLVVYLAGQRATPLATAANHALGASPWVERRGLGAAVRGSF
jgi:tetratricopeptide (TPR) repeat protein